MSDHQQSLTEKISTLEEDLRKSQKEHLELKNVYEAMKKDNELKVLELESKIKELNEEAEKIK